MNARSAGVAVCIGLGLQIGAYAQSPQQPPVFTSSIDVARLDVVVTDKDGRPIPDLRRDEVQVLDGGVLRPALLLQHVAEAGRTYAEAALRTVAAEVSTNQGAPRGQLYLLLFDQEHITPGHEQKLKLAAEQFIRRTVLPQDRVAVYGLPAPGPSLGFTSNKAAALEQIAHIRGNLEKIVAGNFVEMSTQEAFEIARGNEAMLNKFLTMPDEGTTSRAGMTADLARRTGETPETLRRLIAQNAAEIVTRADGDSRRFLQLAASLLRSLKSVDGRKTVLLFSEGFYGDNLATELRSVSAAAAETYAVVYSFDLNERVANMGDEARGGEMASEVLNRTETIGSIAADTNGALLPDALNRLDTAIASIGTPNNDYYIVGFEMPADAGGASAYRKIDVKVSRPGAVVHTRTGYSPAASRIDPGLPAVRRMAIDAALAAPYGHQGLQVEYTTYESHGSAGSERIILSLETELPVAAANGGAAPADVVFVVRDARTGQVAASGADQIALPTSPAPGRATGIGAWRVQFTLAPGEYLMRCIVREPGGLLGSADRQFAVRSLGGPSVAASDLVLGRPGPALPVRAAAYTAEPLTGAVRIFARAPEQLTTVSGRLELLPVDGGAAPAIGVSGVAADTREVDGQTLRDLLFELPLAGVAPGEYVARAEIKSGGEVVAELRRQVRVLDGHAPAVAPAPAVPAAASPSDVASGEIGLRLAAAVARTTDPAARQAADGVAFLKSARYAEAAAALRAAFDANTGNADIAFVLGWAERGAGDNVAAVSAFRNAALLDSSMIPAHLALADTYLAMKQPALAIQALEAGLASHPDAAELKRLLETIR